MGSDRLFCLLGERKLGMLNVDRSNPRKSKKLKIYKIKGISTDEKGWNSKHRFYKVCTKCKIRELLNVRAYWK